MLNDRLALNDRSKGAALDMPFAHLCPSTASSRETTTRIPLMETVGARSREILGYRRDPQAAHLNVSRVIRFQFIGRSRIGGPEPLSRVGAHHATLQYGPSAQPYGLDCHRWQPAWRIATRVISLRWLRERKRHLRGQPLRTAEKQPIEGYSREFADDPQRHFLAKRSTAFDIVPPTAIDIEKFGKLLLVPRPLKPIASRKRLQPQCVLAGNATSGHG